MAGSLKMPMLNAVTLIGRVCSDPDMRHTAGGSGVLNFRIVVDEFWTDKTSGEKKKASSFFSVDLWGKGAEFHAKTLHKGSPVLVQGSLRSRSWEKDGQKHTVVEIRGQRVSTLEWDSEKGAEQSAEPPAEEEPPVGGEF
jgi:single-strand DNA-binding protein